MKALPLDRPDSAPFVAVRCRTLWVTSVKIFMSITSTWIAVFATVAVLAAYEVSLAVIERRTPDRMARTAHAAMRADWFLALSGQKGSEVLVVQTLRNAVMAATMTASTAAVGLIGTVTISASTLHDRFASQSGPPEFTPRLALELVLLMQLFASLISAMMAVRFYNHAGFIGGMPVGSPERRRWTSVGVKYIRRAGSLYSWGLRHLVTVAPVLASLLHPTAGPFAALGIVAVLLHFDRMAAHAEPQEPAGAIVPSET